MELTITFKGAPVSSATTDELGSYSKQIHLGRGTYTIEAHYAVDSDHESSSATRVITVTP